MKPPPPPGATGLVLIRHGKSAWDDPTQPDHARPLAPRGRRDGPRMGAALGALGWAPTAVRCSDAVRGWQTWEGLAAGLRRHPHIQSTLPDATLDGALFHARAADLHTALPLWMPDSGVLWLIGHNPSFEELVELLTGDAVEMPTCAAALLGPGKHPGRWRLLDIVRPKQLADRGLSSLD